MIKVEEYFKKWTSTRSNLKIEFHDAGIEVMAFAQSYHQEQMQEKLEEVGKKLENLTQGDGMHQYYKDGFLNGANFILTRLKETNKTV